MMTLALDGLLDEAERAQFEEYQAQHPALAALWSEWQGLDRKLDLMPHAEPVPGFVSRFESRLAQQEAQQQRRVLAFSLAAMVLALLLGVGGAVWGVAYLTSAQGPWLGEQIHNAVLFSATARQKFMPLSLAVSAVTTIGYLGVLAGPALMGFVAHATSLVIVFCITLALMCFVAVVSRAVP